MTSCLAQHDSSVALLLNSYWAVTVIGNADAAQCVIRLRYGSRKRGMFEKRGIPAMVTDTQQTMTAQPEHGMITRAAEQVRQFICGLHGHDSLLHFEQDRMS